MSTALPTPRLAMLPERPSGGSPARGGGRTCNGAPSLADHQLHVALEWHRRGHGVVPCSRRDKGALVPGFGRDATEHDLGKFRDPDQIRAWWTGKYRRAHVGLLTRRLVVVDLDMRKPGAKIGGRFSSAHSGTDVLEALARDAGAAWPETYEVLTPSGGLHLYFEQPHDGEKIGCSTGQVGPLVDVRGVGGYIIAAGSHSLAQGKPYTRVSPVGLRPQPLPAWLLQLVRPAHRHAPPAPPRPVILPGGNRAEKYAAAALRGEADRVAAARDNERWRTLSGAALRLAELSHTAPRVLSYEVVLEALTAAAAASGMSGGYRRAERAVRTAWNSKALGGAA